MANGAVLLKWRDRNWAEQGHYVYRSDTPMDINNLPSPIGTLTFNQYQYIDYDVIADQTYYYRIGAFRNNDVSVSEEIKVVATPGILVDSIDPFGDGSSLAVYQFDDSMIDLTDNTYVNALAYGYVGGKFNKALDFSTITTGTSTITGLEQMTGSDFSFSTWLNLNNIDHQNGYILVQTSGRTSQQVVILRIWENKLGFYDNVSGYISSLLPSSGWVHVVLSYRQTTNELTFYIDGKIDSTYTINPLPLQGQPIYFGSWEAGNYRYSGLMDQLRIFNKVLTPDEVDMLFNETE